MDVALFLCFGRAVISALGMLKGVNNFIMMIKQSYVYVLGHLKMKCMGETTLKPFALHYNILLVEVTKSKID